MIEFRKGMVGDNFQVVSGAQSGAGAANGGAPLWQDPSFTQPRIQRTSSHNCPGSLNHQQREIQFIHWEKYNQCNSQSNYIYNWMNTLIQPKTHQLIFASSTLFAIMYILDQDQKNLIIGDCFQLLVWSFLAVDLEKAESSVSLKLGWNMREEGRGAKGAFGGMVFKLRRTRGEYVSFRISPQNI